MARLWSCGFELNSTSAEYLANGSGASTISSTVSNGGTYSNQIALTTSNVRNSHKFGSTSQYTSAYLRAYVNVSVFPGTTARILAFLGNGTELMNIALTPSGTFRLTNSATVQTGSDSPAVTTNTWHYIELFMDATPASGSRIATARLDGVQFATGSTFSSTNVAALDSVTWGQYSTNTTTTLYFDDIAVNDTSGSFQNSWPGSGAIVHLRPSASGDSTGWTPLASTNVSQVSEVTPDDASSYVSSAVANTSDLYNVSDILSIPSFRHSGAISLVSVGGRFNNPTADATTSFQFQIEKNTGGTTTTSSAIIPNSTTWSTNVASSSYPITLYQDPNGIRWTVDSLNTMQIGAIIGAVGTFGVQLSTIWALVEYQPTINEPGNMGKYVSVGDGMSRSEVAN